MVLLDTACVQMDAVIATGCREVEDINFDCICMAMYVVNICCLLGSDEC